MVGESVDYAIFGAFQALMSVLRTALTSGMQSGRSAGFREHWGSNLMSETRDAPARRAPFA